MLSLQKYHDLQQHIIEEDDALVDEDNDEAKTTFLIKKNISTEIYYYACNLTRPGEVWSALHVHFSSTSKRIIQTARRALRKITIKTCSFNISTYLHKNTDAINASIGLNVKDDDHYRSDHILEGLEHDFRLKDFFFCQSTNERSDYR